LDDQNQDRIRLETEAIITILKHCQSGEWIFAASRAIDYELSNIKDMDKLKDIYKIYSLAGQRLLTDEQIEERSNFLQGQGMSIFDSLHLALAEAYKYDALLTTDDDFIAVAKKIHLTVRVENPVVWLLEVL
jgi:predicted nucleic acid-binding protein